MGVRAGQRERAITLLGEAAAATDRFGEGARRGPGGAAPCGRNLFYDLGCTVYGKPMPPGAIPSSGRAPSIQFFERMYERNCIVFDRIWAWEAIPYDAASWWRPVPLHVRTKLHFYNLPVNAKWDSDASALRTIHATARPEDFVVVKVDIDGSGPVELEIVKAIADNYPPEIVQYYHPNYSKQLLDKLDAEAM